MVIRWRRAQRAARLGGMVLFGDLLDLLLPSACVCCRRTGPLWCSRCRPAPAEHWASTAEPLVCAAGEYADALKSSLIAYKERGHLRLAPALGAYLADAVCWVADAGGGSGERVRLVPVPSRRSAARARGGDHVLRLSRAAAAELRVRVLPVLRLSGRVRDSAGLSEHERSQNIDHRMSASPPTCGAGRFLSAGGATRSGNAGRTASACRTASAGRSGSAGRFADAGRTESAVRARGAGGAGPPVVLVDDIVTTGATAREGVRALAAAGWQVLGVAAVAATRRRSELPRFP